MKIHMKDIVNHTIFTIKESIKFALLAAVMFYLIGIPLIYIFIKILKINSDISGLIVGVITAIIIVMVDRKKTRCLSKINNNMVETLKKLKI